MAKKVKNHLVKIGIPFMMSEKPSIHSSKALKFAGQEYYIHSKFIRPVSSYETLGGGAPLRTALQHAIHLAYNAQRFKYTNLRFSLKV